MSRLQSAVAWINTRLKPDQARHVVCCAVLALIGAHVARFTLLPPWALALVFATLAGAALEVWQWITNTGHPSWNDMAANVAGGVIVALGTLA